MTPNTNSNTRLNLLIDWTTLNGYFGHCVCPDRYWLFPHPRPRWLCRRVRPFARYKHKDGTDNHPSFSVKVEEFGQSCYHCFTCGSKGLFSFMLKDLEGLGMIIPDGLIARIRGAEKSSVSVSGVSLMNAFGPDMERKIARKEHTVWDESEIAPFMHKTCKYILSRLTLPPELSILTVKAFEIEYDVDRNRVVFPVRKKDGKLVGAMTRLISGSGPKYFPLMPFHKSLFLYGENKLVDSNNPTFLETMGSDMPANKGVIVVEGNFDVPRIYEFGYDCNVVGLMTAVMSAAQAATLRGVNRPVYMMQDWDIAGIRGRDSCIKHLHGQVPLFNVPGVTQCIKCANRFSKVGKLGQLDTLVCRKCGEPWPDVSDKKDPGMLSKEETIDCLKNAECVMSKD